MSTLSLLGGALTLRTQTFTALRERSDVFQRGFVALLIVGWLAGAFAAGVPLITRTVRPATEQQTINQVLRQVEQSPNGGPAARALLTPYITEGVAMGFEISQLPPNAGAAFRPVARLLDWFGALLATPFSFGYMGVLLLVGLFVHWVSRWLGGHGDLAQMFGLTALGWAPQLFNPLQSLLTLAGTATGAGIFGLLNSLLGLVLFLWGAAIYIKATEVAQGFTLERAIGAVLLAVLIAVIVAILLLCIVGAVLGSIFSVLFRGAAG